MVRPVNPFKIIICAALLSRVALAGSAPEAGACIDWFSAIPAHTHSIPDINAPNVFRANFERLWPRLADSDPSLTLLVPARTRTGKSSLLESIKSEWTRKKNGIALSFDVQGLAPDDMVMALERSVKQAGLPPELRQAVGNAPDFFSGLDLIVEFAAKADRPLIVLMDEGSVMHRPVWGDFHQRLLNYDRTRKAVFYAGEKEANVEEYKRRILADDPRKHGVFFQVEPETRESVRKYLNGMAQGSGVSFSDEAVAALHQAAGGWPFGINAIVANFPKGVRRIELEHVLQALKSAQDNYPWYEFQPLKQTD